MDCFRSPLVVEPRPGQLARAVRLRPLRQFDQRIGRSPAFTQALDDPAIPTSRECYCPRLGPRRVGDKLATTLAASAQCGCDVTGIRAVT